MNEDVERYLKEKFESGNSNVNFSDSVITCTVKKDQTVQSSFFMTSTDDYVTKGRIYSTDLRMVCEEEAFCGNEITFRFCFQAQGLEEDHISKGTFHIVSNKGEFRIPFTVTVEGNAIESSLGQIKNLFHFANLAKSNWGEAVKLFYSPQFFRILSGSDSRYVCMYQGLASGAGNEQNVEEFLIEIKKKQAVEYRLNAEQIVLMNPQNTVEEKIRITKSGWGYTALHATAEGDFLAVEKERLNDDDFLGNLCDLDIYVDSTRLHAGNNYGMIRFSYAHGEQHIAVTVKQVRCDSNPVYSKEKELTLQLMNLYLDFRMKRVNAAAWITRTGEIVDKLLHYRENKPAYRLFQAQLLITRERFNEAKWVLEHVGKMLATAPCKPEIECYYRYLMTLYVREESYVDEQTEAIELIYKQQSDNWRIAWLLLYLRAEYGEHPERKWVLLEEQFLNHNFSPVLYIEAVTLLNANSSLLQKLEGFELQVLWYAAKEKLLDKEVLWRVHYLMSHVKSYSERLFSFLTYCYHLTEDTETLQVICEFLIKGNKTEQRCFAWYQLGVAHQLRITKLYEYYVMTLPEDFRETIPKIVMMYFAYSCDLYYDKKALLYANILRHKEEIPEMVRSYREQMTYFVKEQLEKGHINQDLAYLYTEFISPAEMKEETAKALSALLFLQQVEVKDDTVRQVVVIHDRLKGEVRYPVVDKKAWVAVYSREYRIFLQDAQGNRFADCNAYRISPLMEPKKFVRFMKDMNLNLLGLDLYFCEENSDYIVITEENVQQFLVLAKSPQIRISYKREIRVKLLSYYFDNDCIRELDTYLEEIQAEGMQQSERADFIRVMVLRGMYDKVMKWMGEYGTEGVEDKTLLRLCSRVLIRNDFEEDAFLCGLSHLSFEKGRYDEYILEYLVRFYQGTTKELRDLWKAAQNFDVNTFALSERILLQMLFANSFLAEGTEIFNSYVRGGEAGSKTVLAYLTHCAYEYFVEEKMYDEPLFAYLTPMFERKEQEPSTVCRLAYLKYFAEHKELMGAKEEAVIVQLISMLWQENIYFSFFMEFAELVPQLEMMADHTTLEYKTNSFGRVWIHYIFVCEGNEKTTEYRKEEMKRVYGNIYTKPFVLFFGESIQYYITEESSEREELTESGTIRKSDIAGKSKDNKFTMINDMAIAQTLQDYDTLQQLLQEYYKKEYMVSELFPIL